MIHVPEGKKHIELDILLIMINGLLWEKKNAVTIYFQNDLGTIYVGDGQKNEKMAEIYNTLWLVSVEQPKVFSLLSL
jgi:hypothetical protein